MANTYVSRSSENMQVAVRLRPMTNREREKRNKRIVEIERNTVQVMNPKYTHDRYKKFTFDYSYWSYDGFKRNQDGVCVPDLEHPNGVNYVDQEHVFRDLGQFLLDNAISGYHSALLAYGQTGSGKSYTVSGYGANEGILPRFARAIFQELNKCTVASGPQEAERGNQGVGKTSNLNQRYEVYFSMIEIYNEVVRDLLANGQQQQDLNSAAENPLSGGGGQDSNSVPENGPPATPSRVISSSSTTSRGLKIREHPTHGFFVENLSSFVCQSKEEILLRIEEGQLNKSIAATRMNKTSSRGHTIYEFRIKQYKAKTAPLLSQNNIDNINSNTTRAPNQSAGSIGSSSSSSNDEDIVITSVVQLVDLAGSERTAVHVPYEVQSGLVRTASQQGGGSDISNRSAASTTGTATQRAGGGPVGRSSQRSSSTRPDNRHQATRFKESVSINQSLSALGNCIQVMSQNSLQANGGQQRGLVKIPYRDSALTKLLNRCCLSGNSKVVIIATLSPADIHFDETLSTLRFADRAKQIKTHAVINQTTRRASLADGGALGVLATASKESQGKDKTRGVATRLRQINESENSSNEHDPSSGGSIAASRRGSRNPNSKTVVVRRGAGGSRKPMRERELATSTSRENLATLRSNPSLARAPNSNNIDNSTKLRNDDNRALKDANENDSKTQENLRRGQSEQALNGASSTTTSRTVANYSNNGDEDVEDDDVEDEEFINDLIDIRDGFISPESDDSMAALADEDLSASEKIEILNRMLNNSGPSERILAIQEENEPDSSASILLNAQSIPIGLSTTTKRVSLRNNKLKDEIKQVSLISSTLKKTNPYLTNLNADEQLSNLLCYMLKVGVTLIGRAGQSDIIVHGAEIREQHARITRSSNPSDPIYLESIMNEDDGGDRERAAYSSVNIRINGQLVSDRVQLRHCDRILFGVNSYFVFANLASENDSTTNQTDGPQTCETTHQIADLDLITFEMARNEVLRSVMHEDQNKSVIKEIEDYTHRPGTGRFKKPPPLAEQQQAAVAAAAAGPPSEQQKQQQQVAFADNRQSSSQTRMQSRDTIHKLTRSLTMKDSLQTETDALEPETSKSEREQTRTKTENSDDDDQQKSTSINKDDDATESKSLAQLNQDEVYRKQLLEDTYDYVIPVTEVNAIANEMCIKVHYELKILNGEEQLAHQLDRNAFNQNYYDSNTSDGFSSSSVGEDTLNDNRAKQQGQQSYGQATQGRSMEPASSSFNTSATCQSVTSPSDSAATSTSTTRTSNTTASRFSNQASSSGATSDIPTSASSMQQRRQQQASNRSNESKHEPKDGVKREEQREEEEHLQQQQHQQQVTYLTELQDLDIPPELYIRVYLEEFDISFYWHKEKFQARRYKMLELYGPWSLGGKTALVEYLMEQSRVQGNYLIDPFIDDADTNHVLIGHAQVTLQPIAHQTDKRQSYDIVNINDELVGTINVRAIPCHVNETQPTDGESTQQLQKFEPFSEEDLATHILEDPRQLLGKKLAFMLRVVSCNDLPARYTNIFCQYSFGRSSSSTRNKLVRTRVFYDDELEFSDESREKFKHLAFDHSHFVCFESVTEDILDFLEFGFLTIQVVGNHLIAKQLVGQSPTMITTIIRSINKFRFNNYAGYYLESANSSSMMTTSGGGANKSNANAKNMANNQANSGSTMSNSAKTINMYEQNNGDFDENRMPLNGHSQDNLVDMILTKRKLDRAEDKLHLIKRTVNMAEHYNRKHIPIKVVKKLLNSYGQEVIQTSIEEIANSNSHKQAGTLVACLAKNPQLTNLPQVRIFNQGRKPLHFDWAR